VQETPKQWTKWLPLAELWYNTSFHSSLHCTLFKALYGVDPPSGILPQLKLTDNSDVSVILKERQLFTEILKNQLAKAQNKMKIFADSNKSVRAFQVGEALLLKLQPYAQSSMVNCPFPKLAFKYFGPYEVLAKVGQTTYKLKLPDNSMIHDVFHVSQLKAFTIDHSPVFSQLTCIPALDVADLVPEKILDRRLVKKGQYGCDSSPDTMDRIARIISNKGRP
jgi:hypothetical protein